MAISIVPTSFSLEKWMRQDLPFDGTTLFEISGFAQFGPGVEVVPVPTQSLIGTGENDTTDQLKYVVYQITDMLVGPHWRDVQQVCPSVWAAGHDQAAPDEADGMGYEVPEITEVTLAGASGDQRLELKVLCKVAGGFDPPDDADDVLVWGRVPSLAYRVTAIGNLALDIGNEGVFFGQDGF